jgi:hypothetical protein
VGLVPGRLKVHRILSDVVHVVTDVAAVRMRGSGVLSLWGRVTHCGVLVVGVSPDCTDVGAVVAEVAKVLGTHAEGRLVVVSGEAGPLAGKLGERMRWTSVAVFSNLVNWTGSRSWECWSAGSGSGAVV